MSVRFCVRDASHFFSKVVKTHKHAEGLVNVEFKGKKKLERFTKHKVNKQPFESTKRHNSFFLLMYFVPFQLLNLNWPFALLLKLYLFFFIPTAMQICSLLTQIDAIKSM